MAIKVMRLLRNQYPGKFEAYMISDRNGKFLYAGHGRCGIRAETWLAPIFSEKFNRNTDELKILFRVIVATKYEAIELEEKFIEKFKPEFNIYTRSTEWLSKKTQLDELREKMRG